MKTVLKIFLIILVSIGFSFAPISANESDITWITTWSESLFDQAKKENKFIILDLEAIWCHWCHVMHKETYSNPGVVSLLKEYYLPVRVDQDSRPDLSNRYRDYGWPATIVFNSKGEEIVKRSGYIQPEEMKQLLQKIVDDPTPEEKYPDDAGIQFSSAQTLTDELKKELQQNNKSSYDPVLGGLKLGQKFLDNDSIEYSLILAKTGDKEQEKMAKKTLGSAIKLIDPVWGGAYQYSTMGGWDYPHFEKLTTIQARFLHIYSNAYSQFKDPKYLKAAENIYRYLKEFISSEEGTFYVSQDADLIQGKHSSEYFKKNDSERRKLGIPRVDKHVYSSQNGLVINALVDLYRASGNNQTYLYDAIRAANWILKNRFLSFNLNDNLEWIFSDWTSTESILKSLKWVIENQALPVNGFRHDEKDSAGPFLSDTLNMGRAFLSLYNATHDKKWLVCAEQALNFIDLHFTSPIVGFATSEASCKVCAVRSPSRLIDENIEVARFANDLFEITKNEAYKQISAHAMKYLATPEIATSTLTEPGILIADLELNN